MNVLKRGIALMLAGAATLTCGQSFAGAQERRLYVSSVASSLVEQGLAAPAPTGPAANDFEVVPAPGVQFKPNVARATNVPWIDSNGWRFQRGARKVNYTTLPAGSASLAAAEAVAFDVEAILNPDPADLQDLETMLRFLKANDHPPLPSMANIGVVDDRSARMGEILNLLTRSNLLYRVVPAPVDPSTLRQGQGRPEPSRGATRSGSSRATSRDDSAQDRPDPTLDLTVQLGTEDFPTVAAANPYEFAARVRAKLGDDKRLVRLYGTNTVIARLTGDRTRARLYLLSYAARGRQQRSNLQAMRVRVLGRYQPVKLAAYGVESDAALTDIRNPDNATEFWVPDFNVIAVIDLKGAK